MQLEWNSYQGRERVSNNDAVAVGWQGKWLLCMLVDAAARSDKSQAFAQHWARQTLRHLLQQPIEIGTGAVTTLLGQEQQRLRDSFLLELGSYCLLCLDTESGQAHTYHVGDCRVGQIQAEGIAWCTAPHTLDQQVADGCRHTLTHSLNAKRFAVPEISTFQLLPTGKLLMATDGYWAECLQGENPYAQTQDDASYLTLENGAWAFDCQSDTDNSFVMTEPNL